MKGLITSLLLLVFVIVAVSFNYVYVNGTIETLGTLAEQAWQEKSPDNVSELIDYWEKHRPYIGLSVSLREIDSVTENLLNLNVACSKGNDTMIEQSYSLFITALEDIKRYEKLSIINIF